MMSSTACTNDGMRADDPVPVPDQFPTGLRVLAVDDDPTCLMVLERMLQACFYEVTTCTQAEVALSMLRERKRGFDIVLSDVHMPDMDGFKLLECIGLEMDLPVIMMSIDEKKDVVMKGITHGACDYLIKPVRLEAIKTIWQHIVRKRRNELKELEKSGSVEDINRRTSEDADYSSSANEGSWRNSKKRKEEEDEVEERDDTSTLKKPRVVWSVELHQQFETAVNQLGIDKAVPKKILELMNVPGLTRENVASHLQKYRLYLRRLNGVSQNHIGQNASFMSPQESNFGLPSFKGLDLQALAISRKILPQSLATLQAGELARPSANTSGGIVNQRDLFSVEAMKLGLGARQQQFGGTNDHIDLLHGHPTTMGPKQLHHVQTFGSTSLPIAERASRTLNLPTDSLGTCSSACLDTEQGCMNTSVMMEMLQSRLRGQLLSETSGGSCMIPLSMEQQQILSNEYLKNSVPQASSLVDYQMNNTTVDLPGNAFPLGSAIDLPIIQSTGMFVDGGRLEVKESRGGFTASYETFHQLCQDYEFKDVDLTFEASRHSNLIQHNGDCFPSVLSHQGFSSIQKRGNMCISGKSIVPAREEQGTIEASELNYSSFRPKAGSVPDLSCDNMIFPKHLGQDDLISSIFKQQQEGVGLADNEFDFDGFPMDDIHV